jgi:dCMP deaminase
MRVAELFGLRSSCSRARVGVIAVREGRIIAAGYVGAPTGLPHCLDVGCKIGSDGGCIRTVHAEANMVAWAAREGISLKGSTVYCTHLPCLSCAKLLGNANIRGFVWKEEYRVSDGWMLLKELGVTIMHYGYDVIHVSGTY